MSKMPLRCIFTHLNKARADQTNYALLWENCTFHFSLVIFILSSLFQLSTYIMTVSSLIMCE